MFSPARTSLTWPKIREVGRFCVNVLAEGHQQISAQMSRSRGGGQPCDVISAGPAGHDQTQTQAVQARAVTRTADIREWLSRHLAERCLHLSGLRCCRRGASDFEAEQAVD